MIRRLGRDSFIFLKHLKHASEEGKKKHFYQPQSTVRRKKKQISSFAKCFLSESVTFEGRQSESIFCASDCLSDSANCTQFSDQEKRETFKSGDKVKLVEKRRRSSARGAKRKRENESTSCASRRRRSEVITHFSIAFRC